MADAHTKFDYQNVGDVLKQMNSTFEQISTTLNTANQYYNDNVNQELKAIYGDLGSQLLLDWDNVSSNFPNFLTNFENWSAVVAASGGNYSKFESDLAGFKSVETGNYLGVSAKKAGVTDAYVNNGTLSQYLMNGDTYAATAATLAGKTYHNPALDGVVYESVDVDSALNSQHALTYCTIAGDILAVFAIGAFAAGGAGAAASSSSSTATAVIEGGASTPLLTGTTSVPIQTFASNVALTAMPAESTGFAAFEATKDAILTASSAAEAAGASFVTYDSAAGIFHFLNAAGGEIGFASAANNFLWTIIL